MQSTLSPLSSNFQDTFQLGCLYLHQYPVGILLPSQSAGLIFLQDPVHVHTVNQPVFLLVMCNKHFDETQKPESPWPFMLP